MKRERDGSEPWLGVLRRPHSGRECGSGVADGGGVIRWNVYTTEQVGRMGRFDVIHNPYTSHQTPPKSRENDLRMGMSDVSAG
jgi:hypothetical protein